jgi:hypothetical protein
MPPIAYFAVKLLQNRVTTVILVALLIVSLPIFFVSRYGDQASDYISPSTMASLQFFEDSTTHGIVVSDGLFGATRNVENYTIFGFTTLIGNTNPLANLSNVYPQYICIDAQDQALFDINYGNPTFMPEIQEYIDNEKNFDLTYMNPDVMIYVDQGQ